MNKEITTEIKKYFIEQIENKLKDNTFKNNFEILKAIDEFKEKYEPLYDEIFRNILQEFYPKINVLAKGMYERCPKCHLLGLEDIRQEIILFFHEALKEIFFEQKYLQ